MIYEAALVVGCVAGLYWRRTRVFIFRFCQELGFPLDEDPSVAEGGTHFSVQLRRPESSALGVRVGTPDGQELLVQAVTPGGLLDEWNCANPAKAVGVNDRILRVNGNRGDAAALVEELGGDAPVLDIVVSPAPAGSLQPNRGQPLPSEEWAKAASDPARPYAGEPEQQEDEPSETSLPIEEPRAAGGGPAARASRQRWDQPSGGLPPGRQQPSHSNGVVPSFQPKPRLILFKDPTSRHGQSVGVVAFHHDGEEEAWDVLCGAGFLGNAYDLSPARLELEAPCDCGVTRSFRNAEAAFHALKFWFLAEAFAGLSGQAAIRKLDRLHGHEDLTYGGYGTGWNAMWAVLNAKFGPGMPWAEALLKTGDAFLLKHDSIEGRDKVWSDNSDGEGANWLGVQLMLIRDQLSGNARWTDYIKGVFITESGGARTPAKAAQWQDTVRRARVALLDKLERG